VRIRNDVDESVCDFVKQLNCNTRRNNGTARCEKWHKKNAAKAGADTIVMISSASEQNPFTVNGQLYTSNNTSITADYFVCGKIKDEKIEKK
jgi:hypothetical protein